jgi:hypothetical protein
MSKTTKIMVGIVAVVGVLVVLLGVAMGLGTMDSGSETVAPQQTEERMF